MADLETMRAALLDGPKLPFRITSGQRLLPGRCWSGSRQPTSIRSISRSGRAKPLTLVIPCRRSFGIDLAGVVETIGSDVSAFRRGDQGVCTENLNPEIVVMKSAQDGKRPAHTGPPNRARNGRILVQGQVRPRLIIVASIAVASIRFQVGSRTGAPAGLSTVPRLQSPPRRTQRADFPHCALPFASRQGLWDLSGWGSFQSVASHSIAVEQPQSVVQPRPIPPLPAEALPFPSLRQMAPDLLFHPIFDVAEALTGVSNREVVHAPPELPIDQAYHPVNRLRPVSAKHLFKLEQKRRPPFELGRVMRPHHSA
jgi:hypothetical protein